MSTDTDPILSKPCLQALEVLAEGPCPRGMINPAVVAKLRKLGLVLSKTRKALIYGRIQIILELSLSSQGRKFLESQKSASQPKTAVAA